jgi:SAM-dependent methyltransferase
MTGSNSTLTLPFRAIRFAAHLVLIGQAHILFKTLASTMAHIAACPWFVYNLKKPSQRKVRLQTEYPVALDSPDHITPWGTAYNNVTNFAFIKAMTRKYGRGTYLDIGCSSGRLVYDFARVGWLAVGLEGSNYSLKTRRGAWPHYHNLMTCDISKPFDLDEQFDVITAWDVLEHLTKDGLDILIGNVHRLMRPRSIFIVTTANNSEIPTGFELHQTQWTSERWIQFFISNGFCVLPRKKCIKRCQMVRHSVDNSEFTLALENSSL